MDVDLGKYRLPNKTLSNLLLDDADQYYLQMARLVCFCEFLDITQKVRGFPRTFSGSDGIRTRGLGLDRAAC